MSRAASAAFRRLRCSARIDNFGIFRADHALLGENLPLVFAQKARRVRLILGNAVDRNHMSGSRLPAVWIWCDRPFSAGPPERHLGWGSVDRFRVTDCILLSMDGELATAPPPRSARHGGRIPGAPTAAWGHALSYALPP
jgi:hypothetical protein